MSRLALAAVLSLALPTGLTLCFRAPLPWWLILLYVALKLGLEHAEGARAAGSAPGGRPLGPTLTVSLAVVLLAGLLITPYSAYDIWHRSLAGGEPRGGSGGVVSTLFSLLGLLLGGCAGTVALRGRPLAATWLALLFTAGVLAAAFRRLEWYLLLALLAAGGPALLASPRGGFSLPRLGFSLAVFLLAAAGSALIVLPAALRSGGEPRGSRLVSERLHPALRQAAVGLLPRFPLLYGIPGYGYGFSERRLGGRPALSEAPLFEVAAGPVGSPTGFPVGSPTGFLYLRTAAYDAYDGSSWSRSAGGQSPEPGGPIVETAADPPPAGALRVTLLAELYTRAPHTLDTRRLLLPPGLELRDHDLHPPWRRGESLYLVRGDPEPVRLSAEALARYRSLPGGVPDRIAGLARGLADPSGDPAATLGSIQDHLSRGYTYNLKAPPPRPGEDFVETFLFRDRQGYCVHFASAFVVLARLAGLPARYTVGFLVAPPPPGPAGTAPRSVSGLSAHAWAEVWLQDPRGLPGEGFWGTWEATTALDPLYREQTREAGEVNRLTRRQLEALLGSPLAAEPRPRGARLPALHAPLPVTLAALAGLLLAAALTWAALRYRVLLFAGRAGNPRGDRRLVRALLSGRAGRGLPLPAARGWMLWCRELAGRVPLTTGRAARLREILLRFAYSDRLLSPRDRRYLRAFYLRYCGRRYRTRPCRSSESRPRTRISRLSELT